MNQKIKIIEDYVKKLTDDSHGHGFDHTDRVRHWALKIARAEKYNDLEKVEAAALLHDIGLPYVRKRLNHGRKGAVLARRFLTNQKLFSPVDVQEICQAIEFHCQKNQGQGKLLDILKDADMLDLFGLIGCTRAIKDLSHKITFNQKHVKGQTWGLPNSYFSDRINKHLGHGDCIVDAINFLISCQENLSTDFAKQKAKKLVQAQKDFLIALEKEVKMCYH